MQLDHELISAEDRAHLQEFARRVASAREQFIAEWIVAWIEATPPRSDVDPQAYAQLITHIVETQATTQLEAMQQGDFQRIYVHQYEHHRLVARGQVGAGALMLSDLRDIHRLSRIAQAVFRRWIERVFAGDEARMVRVLLAQERLGAQMAQIVSEAHSEVGESHLRHVTARLRDALELSQRLASLTQALVQSLDTGPVLELAMQCAMQLLRTDGAAVMLPDADDTMLEIHSLTGADLERIQQRVRIADSAAGWVYRNNTALHWDRVRDPALMANIDRIQDNGVARAVMIVPLRMHGTPIGTMAVGSNRERSFTDSEAGVLQTLADYAAIAFTNARSHAALREAKEQAEAADRAKSEFIAAVSHEIRSPLNAMLGYVSILREEWPPELGSDLRHFLDRVDAVAQSTHRLTDDLLESARLETGKLKLEIGEVPVAPLMEEGVETLRVLVGERPIAIELELRDRALAAIADPHRVRQILVNLTTNAAKFTERGSVTLEAEGDADNGVILLRVRDTGIGISPNDLSHLFELFYRGGGEDVAAGAGIGLFLSRELARRMGGDIRAESELGVGTCFTLSLPAA